jgi:hypothetical protein
MKIKSCYKVLFVFYTLYTIDCALYVYADTLNRAEALYLQGSYSESIAECALNIARGNVKDKAYYLLGLNYLKINDTENAREKLKILMDSYRSSPYYESAKLSYADTYFIDQDYQAAQKLYEGIIKDSGKLAGSAYLRLLQCGLKTGDWEKAKGYADILQKDYPLSLDAQLAKELMEKSEFFFTVQVGSFANIHNAKGLAGKLRNSGFDAYIDELKSGSGAFYRVRVGKLSSRQEAENLKNTLDVHGYPTKIFP